MDIGISSIAALTTFSRDQENTSILSTYSHSTWLSSAEK